MEFPVHVSGITKRWILNIFLVTFCAVIALVTLFCVLFSQYYYEAVRSVSYEYASGFSVLSSVAPEKLVSAAKEYTENFENKDKIEVQIISNTGTVIATTSGFLPDNAQSMPDYEQALTSSDQTGYFFGKAKSGERVMAESWLIYDNDTYAVRWIISAEACYRHVLIMQFIAVALGILMIGFTAVSGTYFLSSIIKPLHAVSTAARKIAMGDYTTALNVSGKNEISELCDSINYMASELAATDKMKNDFISSVSHELRTPLTAIRGWGETSKMSVGTDDELVNKGLDVVLSETERLSGLVEELLDFSRMQTGRLKVEMSPMKASEALSAAVDMYEELTRRQGIELLYMPIDDEPFILGDINRLKQVFINIIDNAVKYTQSGGQIIANMQLEEGCITIKITDTGAGIPAQDIDKVKEKFFKSDKSVRGSGIGLAVADEIMKQHNGLLFLESTEGVGTSVTAVLPVSYAEPEDSETKTEVSDI